MRPGVRAVLQVVLLAAVYVATARLGLMLEPVGGFASLVWPPSGIALAVLLIAGTRLWPGVALGALIANVLTGATITAALGIAAGNTLAAVLGAAGLRRIPGFDASLERVHDVLGFVSMVVVACCVSATAGVSSLLAAGIVGPASSGETWRAWWLGDVIGDLVVAPLLVVWWARRGAVRRARLALILESMALAAAVLILALFIFSDPYHFTYLLFPPLIWAALRFGPPGVVATTFFVTVLAVTSTVLGSGPFARASLTENLINLQAFMAVISMTFLILGATVSERRRQLERSAALAADNERLFHEEQKARAVAEEAVRARDAFFSVASHELRTPLTALQLNVEALQRHTEAGDREAAIRIGSRVRRQIQRLSQLIDALLDVTRIIAGRLHLDRSTVDLSSIVRDVVQRSEEDIRRAGCDVDVQAVAAAVGTWDALRLEQVVTNLLSNALKYGAGKPISVRVELDDDSAKLVVEDHGVGIAEEDVPRIFEQFHRLEPTSAARGLGLGLWIVREIAVALGGSISVTSELGRGSTFVFELPRSR